MSRSQHGTSTPQSAAAPPAQETRTIERRVEEFAAAWNRHDPGQMAALWHDDGDLVNPFGRLARGRDQVQQLFRDEHTGQGPMKNCSHQMAISSLRLVANELAVVDADCTLNGMRGPDGKEMPTFKPHVLLVMSKREGDWKILSARAYAYMPRPETAS